MPTFYIYFSRGKGHKYELVHQTRSLINAEALYKGISVQNGSRKKLVSIRGPKTVILRKEETKPYKQKELF